MRVDCYLVPKNFSIEELEFEFEALMKRVYSNELVAQRKKHFKQTLLNKRKIMTYGPN